MKSISNKEPNINSPYMMSMSKSNTKKKIESKNTNKTSKVSFEARPKNETDTGTGSATIEQEMEKAKIATTAAVFSAHEKSNSSDEEIIRSWCTIIKRY